MARAKSSKKITAVIVQCRLSSTRLPGKALKTLCVQPVLEWNLNAMRKVRADRYFLACDYDSASELFPVAEKCGFETFAGSKEDVLDRYCTLIEKIGADIVVRATADNPFLFYEAAELLRKEYSSLSEKYDYMTYTGLPHGSGVEIFNAHSLLRARTMTDSAYDHEHVGPALYNHPESFRSNFQKADEKFFYPEYRTTIDTFTDFKRAELIADYVLSKKSAKASISVKKKSVQLPVASFTTKEIIDAIKNTSSQSLVLFVPSVKKGRGTGHLRRCLSLAKETGGFVFISYDADLEQAEELIKEAVSGGLAESKIIRGATLFPSQASKTVPLLNGDWQLVVTDLFSMTKEEAAAVSKLGPVVSIDEGSSFHESSDYLIDCIPSYKIKRHANIASPAFIPMPKNRRTKNAEKKSAQLLKKPLIKKALIAIGGEDPADFTEPVSKLLSQNGVDVTICGGKNPAIPNLKEKLFEYDLVVTHFGFTAFEALCAGCAVLLVETTPLHKKLSEKYGFMCVSKKTVLSQGFSDGIKKIILNPEILSEKISGELKEAFASPVTAPVTANKNAEIKNKESALGKQIQAARLAKKMCCPVCRTPFNTGNNRGKVIARTPKRTFRRCPECGMIYMSFNLDSDMQYEKSYFDNEYKNQYGRTYLDDFESIKNQGLRRAKIIRSLTDNGKQTDSGTILDIGCAYGPFLSAAKDTGFVPYGTDISRAAVSYIKKNLSFSAINASFADFDSKAKFGVEKFDAVTMWYVIEHIQDLKKVLCDINSKVKTGGIFAFSTPSASGVSGKLNRQSFFENSPKDHYTIWEINRAKKILSRFGFKVVKIVGTGHHPERFPIMKKYPDSKFLFKILNFISRIFKFGDTCEVYCKKISEIKNGGAE